MPQVIAAVVAVFAAIGTAVGASAALAAYVGAAIVIGAGVIAATALVPKLQMARRADNDRTRQSTVKSTVEPQKIIYGEALVSGPITFVGVSGDDNEIMHHVVALAGHEVNAITEIWLDDQKILQSQLNGAGLVTSGTFQNIVTITRFLGTTDQTADANLVANWFDYTTFHRGREIAYIHTQFELNDASQEVWDKYSPNNIKALVQGRKIYDPRLDTTPGANPTNATYIAYSSNPALAIADYLINTRFGMKIAPAKIDWPAVVQAANACDVLVDIPGGVTEKRFTANGVLFATDSHKGSIDKLLSAMNGKLVYSSGIYYIKAGIYEAPTESLDEEDLSGPVSVKTSVERSDRFNTVGGMFMDPAQLHKTSEFPKVTITAALLRDNNEVLEKEIELPFTNSSYMAQRIANKLIQISDQQKLVNFPANLAGLRVAVGDRVSVSIDELNWSSKVFECLGWSFNDGGDNGVMLTLREDDASSYADMLVGEYSVVTADGVIEEGFPGVPDPQNLAATSGLKSIDLNWLNPVNTAKFKEIAVYASPNSSWANKVEIGRTMGTQFFHDASNAADPVVAGNTRYYWVRALQYGTGTGATAESDRNPDNDTSTVSATVGANVADSVEWVDVGDGNGLRPSNNATVGAQASIDLLNSTGVVLGDDDVLNSVVFEDITQVQLAGTGDILELIGGAAVDLQQLGDVAKYAYDADQVLNGYINGLNASFGNLQETLVDITSGVADVFVSDTAPVAGVGGVPDPIVIYSRWYDSDDSNKPHYWNGTAWIDLSDPRIGSNEAEISAVSSNLVITDGIVGGHTTTITAHSNAFSVLDSTTIPGINGDITSITGRFDTFESAYIEDDPVGVSTANSSAIGSLTTRVSNAEGLIGTSSLDITELNSSITYYTKLEGTDGEPLQLISGDEIDLQGTSAVGGANANATNALETRVQETETGLISQASSIVSLNAEIAATNLNVGATAGALSGLTIIVETQGDIVTATASDLLELTARVGTTEGSINQLNSVSITSTSALVQSHLALTGTVGDAEGEIAQLNTVDVTSTSALVQAHLTLSGSVGDAQGDIVQINTVDVSSTSALVQNFLTLSGSVGAAEGEITQLNTVDVGSTSALVQSHLALSGSVEDAEGEITQLNTVTVDSTSALVQAHLALSASVGDAEGEIVQLNTVTVNSTSALVQAHLAVSSTVGANTASISTQATSINGIEANYGVKVDINGRVTGFGLNSTVATATPTSEFYVIADKFAVVDPASTASTPIIPFSISGSNITLTGNVVVNGSLLVAGSVSTLQMDDNAITSAKISTQLQSDNFVTGSSGWRIEKSGAAEFNGPVISRQILVDSGTYSFGSGANARYTSITETLSAFITTNLAFSAWNGTAKSYVVSIGVSGSITANTSDVISDPSTILWGFTGEIFPLTAWSGGQNVRILAKLYTQKTVGYTGLNANWKIYEVT
jgi:hypothetical protein